MGEKLPPFVDDGKGYPTESSVVQAFADCDMTELAYETGSYHGKTGPMVPLITRFCRTEHVKKGYPEEFRKIVSVAILAAD